MEALIEEYNSVTKYVFLRPVDGMEALREKAKSFQEIKQRGELRLPPSLTAWRRCRRWTSRRGALGR